MLAYVVLYLPYTVQYVTSAFSDQRQPLAGGTGLRRYAFVCVPARYASDDLARHFCRVDDDLHHRLPRARDGKLHRTAEYLGRFNVY